MCREAKLPGLAAGSGLNEAERSVSRVEFVVIAGKLFAGQNVNNGRGLLA